MTGTSKTTLYFIVEKKEIVFMTEVSQGVEEVRRKGAYSTLALNWFDHDRGSALVHRLSDALDAGGDIEESVHRRPQS
tara:strand:+ start:367 stop:600 length:234 start_codon:yes stop_codon:yes gene_type:complete